MRYRILYHTAPWVITFPSNGQQLDKIWASTCCTVWKLSFCKHKHLYGIHVTFYFSLFELFIKSGIPDRAKRERCTINPRMQNLLWENLFILKPFRENSSVTSVYYPLRIFPPEFTYSININGFHPSLRSAMLKIPKESPANSGQKHVVCRKHSHFLYPNNSLDTLLIFSSEISSIGKMSYFIHFTGA